MRHMWQQAELARVGLLENVKLYEEKDKPLYQALVGKTLSTRQAFEEILQEGDFPMATTWNEGDGVAYSDFFTGNAKRYYPLMRAIGYSVSKPAKFTDLYGVVSKPSRKMYQALKKAKEQKVANIFVNHTSTSFTGADGSALVSTTHGTRVGVSANRPATDIGLGYLALAQAIQELMRTKSHEGDPYAITGSFKLVVPPELADLAHRVAEPHMGKIPQSANNDKAWASGMVSGVLVNQYLTSTSAWWLLIDGEDNPIRLLNRIPLFTESDYDMDNQKFKFVVGEEYDAFWNDWRGIWGTTG